MADSGKKFLFSKNFLLWTGWYFVASYLIFLFVFHFNILQAADWAKVLRISLHGFSGLAFGVALIAFIPIWLAGAIAIHHTGKPLFGTAKSKTDDKKTEESKPLEEPEPKIEFPKNLPEEMKVPYSRMLRGQLSRGAMDCHVVQNGSKTAMAALSAECKPDVGNLSVGAFTQTDGEMTLPDSFDMETPESDDAPMFREITFGDDAPTTSLNNPSSSEIKIEVHGDKKFAIITHDDSDFWIADDDNWFATGKQKPSPITAVIAAAKEKDATPVLYLASENIMDLDSQKEKWQNAGVIVVKDLSELN